jgi:hypothetical protein
MPNFKIKFLFKDVDYTANVHKPAEHADKIRPAHYQVRNIRPEIPGLPDTYSFVYEVYEQQFSFPPFNHSNELPEKMLSAIKKYCEKHNLPFVL